MWEQHQGLGLWLQSSSPVVRRSVAGTEHTRESSTSTRRRHEVQDDRTRPVSQCQSRTGITVGRIRKELEGDVVGEGAAELAAEVCGSAPVGEGARDELVGPMPSSGTLVGVETASASGAEATGSTDAAAFTVLVVVDVEASDSTTAFAGGGNSRRLYCTSMADK
jgi:hypothetical protein